MAALHFPFSWAHPAFTADTTKSLIDPSPVGDFKKNELLLMLVYVT